LVALSEKDREFIDGEYPGVELEQVRPGANYRTWTSKNGRFKTVAEFLDYSDGKLQLRKMDGEEIWVPRTALCSVDQTWLREELVRIRKEGPRKPSSDVSPAHVGKLDPGTIAMKLLRLDPPNRAGGGGGNPAVEYLLRMTRPQTFYMGLGRGADAGAAAFQRIVTKEPKYNVPNPFRGVAKLGSHQYGFALDAAAGAAGYNQLYFDLNHNGDLTDDKPVSAVNVSRVSSSSSQSQFPRVDLQIEADGTQVDYAFLMSAYARKSTTSSYVSTTLFAGAVREGYLGKGTKRTRVVLLDQNSNGRFDDQATVRTSSSRVYPSVGDLLLVNPNLNSRPSSGSTSGLDRHFVAKTACIGKHFYEMEVSPAGDQLKLTPTDLALGQVTNPSPAYRAVVYNGELGMLNLSGTKSDKVPLPEGDWKVASYTLDASAMTGGARTTVAASFGSDYKPVTVKKDETVEIPFGAPYKPVVTGRKYKGNKVYLSLAIVGVAGERCTSLYVNGKRPPAPQFTITSSTGETVHQGKFEYG
jgi:hypothetical protein